MAETPVAVAPLPIATAPDCVACAWLPTATENAPELIACTPIDALLTPVACALMPTAVEPSAIACAPGPRAVADTPCAVDRLPNAVEFVCAALDPTPIEIELTPPVAVPPSGLYCACAPAWNSARYADAINTVSRLSDGTAGMPARTAAAPSTSRSGVPRDDATRLPRARSSSEAATQAPNASFQIDLNDLFILSSLGSHVLDDATANTAAGENVLCTFPSASRRAATHFGSLTKQPGNAARHARWTSRSRDRTPPVPVDTMRGDDRRLSNHGSRHDWPGGTTRAAPRIRARERHRAEPATTLNLMGKRHSDAGWTEAGPHPGAARPASFRRRMTPCDPRD
nr:hypothetical protein [Burkholderia lata]